MYKVIAILIAVGITLIPVSAFALGEGFGFPQGNQSGQQGSQSGPQGNQSGATSITLRDLEVLVEDIIQFFITIATLCVVGAIVYAGFLMTTAGSDSARFTAGRTMLTQAVIGGVIIFGVSVIVNTIADFANDPTQITR